MKNNLKEKYCNWFNVERRVLSPRSVFTMINYVNINVYTNVKGDVKWQIRQYLQ